MRALLVLATTALLALASVCVTAQPAPAMPGQTGSDSMCLLDGLYLNGGSGGLKIGRFRPTTFTYQCSGSWNNIGLKKFNPSLEVHMMDWGSNAQIWFNGVAVRTRLKGNELTNDQTNSGGLASPGNDWREGENLIQILVGCDAYTITGQTMCRYQYTIKCYKPKSNGSGMVTGDPQFKGLRGQDYQVHGVAGQVYNIISDPALQFNARFVFLHKGDCPMTPSRDAEGRRILIKAHGCWSHPGSYLGELGLKTPAGEKILIASGSAKGGFTTVRINNTDLDIGDSAELQTYFSPAGGDDDGSTSGGFITRSSTHVVNLRVGVWEFVFENSDMFINQRVRVRGGDRAISSLRAHGLLGQTWSEATYPGAVKEIEGEVEDYAVEKNDLFGDDFKFNAFN